MPDAPTLRAALWAGASLRRVRRALREDGIAGVRVGPPPALPPAARRGVLGVLRRSRSTCLERALVLQRWEAAHGVPTDVIIGVTAPTDPSGGFRAHAWLEAAPDGLAPGYHELHRLPPP